MKTTITLLKNPSIKLTLDFKSLVGIVFGAILVVFAVWSWIEPRLSSDSQLEIIKQQVVGTEVIIEGKTLPEQTVRLIFQDNIVDQTRSDRNGAFAFVIASPSEGEHNYVLETCDKTENNCVKTKTKILVTQENQEQTNPSISEKEYFVERVVDGDTIILSSGERIRYIGVDSPEIDDNACYSQESKLKNQELVEGKQVKLEKDVSDKDRYGRLLRYVYIDDQMVNELLVKEGVAIAKEYPPDVKYQNRFLELESEAQKNQFGMWSACDL